MGLSAAGHREGSRKYGHLHPHIQTQSALQLYWAGGEIQGVVLMASIQQWLG